MKLFLQYLWTNRRTAAVLAVCAVIFCAVLWLYAIPADAALLAAVLSGVFSLSVLTVRFVRWRRVYLQRAQMMQAPALLHDALPETDDPSEAQYQAMLQNLRTLYTEQVNRTERERTDTTDYFTQWVHQIKTPVSVMRMMLQAEDTDEHRALQSELFRVEQYAEMALAYTRLDSSARDLVIQETALDPVIRAAIRKYAPLFIRRKLRIVYDGTTESALTDEKWLQFILEQILSNAVKYTDTGSVTVTVTEQTIRIADTGKGIAPEDLPCIFEKGYTGRLGRADKQATGIGLYLCKKAADRLNIRLTAESECGKGSAFTLHLHADARQYE